MFDRFKYYPNTNNTCGYKKQFITERNVQKGESTAELRGTGKTFLGQVCDSNEDSRI